MRDGPPTKKAETQIRVAGFFLFFFLYPKLAITSHQIFNCIFHLKKNFLFSLAVERERENVETVSLLLQLKQGKKKKPETVRVSRTWMVSSFLIILRVSAMLPTILFFFSEKVLIRVLRTLQYPHKFSIKQLQNSTI